MQTKHGKKPKKCRICKGDLCIHECIKQKDNVPVGPTIAEQCMEILDKLLKEKEETPEDILKLATQDQLFQIGMDPLCLVAAMGNVEVMRRFLDAGSNVNVRSPTVRSAGYRRLRNFCFALAAKFGHHDVQSCVNLDFHSLVYKELLSSNYMVYVQQVEQPMELLTECCLVTFPNRNHIRMTQATNKLFPLPEGLRTQIEDGSTPLMLATQNRHQEMAELLLKHGADVTAVNVEKNNSFCISVRTGDAKLVNTLWPYRGDLDINHANAEGLTVLHFAAEKMWEACVGFLLTNGAHINRQNHEGFTPLMIACKKGDLKTVEKFLSSGADFLLEDTTGLTAVCWALVSQKFDIFNLILNKMSTKDKEQFIKARIERMKNPHSEHDNEAEITYYEDVLIPMFNRLAKMKEFMDALLKQKFIASAIAVFTKHIKHTDCIMGICLIVSLCMIQHSKMVDEAVIQQFIRCRGPEFIIKALKFYMESTKGDTEILVTCFFPLVCISKTSEGKEWLEKNSIKVNQYVSVKPYFPYMKSSVDGFLDKAFTIWTDFWDYFGKMTQCQMDRKMAELLEEEENERFRKTKKREKKRQKRQTQRKQKCKETASVTCTTTVQAIPEMSASCQVTETANEKDHVITVTKKPAVQFKCNTLPNESAVPDITFGNFKNDDRKTNGALSTDYSECILDFASLSSNAYNYNDIANENQWVTVQGKKERTKANKVVDEVNNISSEQKSDLEIQQITKVRNENRRKPASEGQRRAKGNISRWADMVKGGGANNFDKAGTELIADKCGEKTGTKTYDEEFPVLAGMPTIPNERCHAESKSQHQAHKPLQVEQQVLHNTATGLGSFTTDSEDFRSEITSNGSVFESVTDGDYGRLTPSSEFTENRQHHSDGSRLSPVHYNDTQNRACPKILNRLVNEDLNYQKGLTQNLISGPCNLKTSTRLFDIASSVLINKRESESCSNSHQMIVKASNKYRNKKTDFLGLPKINNEHSFEFLSSAKTLLPEGWNKDKSKIQNEKECTADDHVDKGKGDAREEYFPDLERKGTSEAVQDWLRKSCSPEEKAIEDPSVVSQSTSMDPVIKKMQTLDLKQESRDITVCSNQCNQEEKYNLFPNEGFANMAFPLLPPQPPQPNIQRNRKPIQQDSTNNIAVIQPIGHGSSRHTSKVNEFSSGQQNNDHDMDDQQRNLTFEESLLRNVSKLSSEKGEVWFPSHIEDTKGNAEELENYSINATDTKQKESEQLVFPGFHDDTTPSTPGKSNMQMLRLLQLFNYYQTTNCASQGIQGSVYGNDFLYYCSAMGISEEQVKGYLKSNQANLLVAQINNLLNAGKVEAACKEDLKRSPVRSQIDERNNAVLTMQNCEQPRQWDRPVGEPVVMRPEFTRDNTPAMAPDRKKDIDRQTFPFPERARYLSEPSAVKWISKSKRWKDKLCEIAKMPSSFLRKVGDIILPSEYMERYAVPYSDGSAVLGLLADGTEVAVHIIDMCTRPITEVLLQKLTSSEMSHYFLAKYRTFSIESNTCYLAIDLHEYNLSEYIAIKQLDINTDPLSVNKMVWQVLKGMAYIHDNCDVIHGNIMPSNILVDGDEKLKVSEYCLPRLETSRQPLIPTSPMPADRYCWMPTEIATESGNYTQKSDIQVTGMLLYYILTGGKHPYGDNNLEIQVSIHQNWPEIVYLGEEVNHLLSVMLCMPPENRPSIGDLLKHPYFWADEKRLRFVLIAGSDVLRDMKLGVPTYGGGGDTMIDIINSTCSDVTFNDWTSQVDAIIMKEMRSFRQYKNTLVELVLFVYNCCLHFDKLSNEARDVLDEPCRYFLSKFPTLFMSVFGAIRGSDRSEKICYKPFF